MLIVLDTNVIVSGLISPKGRPARVLNLVLDGTIQLCIDHRILAEYQSVLRRNKFPFNPDTIGDLLIYIEHESKWLTCTGTSFNLPDPDDTAFVEVASCAGDVQVVTGNLRHFPPAQCGGIVAVSPGDFLARNFPS